MLPKKNGYEAIPDVAAKNGGGDQTSSAQPPLSPPEQSQPAPQERYPEANLEEAELLGLLDEFVQESTVVATLPTVLVYDFADNSSSRSCLSSFVFSLMIPTVCSLMMAGIAVWIVRGEVSASSYIARFFPYAAALVVLLGSIVPMQRRCTEQAKQVSSKVEPTNEAAIKAVRDVASSVSQKIALVRMKLEECVDFMRPKLKKASKSEKKLKKMDPTIEIPDPDDIFTDMDGAEDEVKNLLLLEETVIKEIKENLIKEWIPPHLRSAQAYQSYVFSRAVTICLVLQLVVVHLMATYYPMDGSPETAASSKTRLMTRVSRGDLTAVSNGTFDTVKEAWPYPLIFVVEVYLMTMLQLLFVILKTGPASSVAVVNRMRSKVTTRTNLLLRQQGIVFLCQDILDRRMREVKGKLLDRIRFIYKLSMLIKIVEENPSSPPQSPRRRSPAETPGSPERGSESSARKLLKNLWSSSDVEDSESAPKPSSPERATSARKIFKTLRGVPDS